MVSLTEKKVVLLLDDDKFLLDMYSMKFQQQGYTVQAFLSANDALTALRAGFSPDVMLFDLVMPEKDGMSFLTDVGSEKLAPHAIKIVLSNQNDDTERAKALELGAEQCIVKASAVPSEVVTIVEKAITSKRKP
jgi:CheY-like chemotaxis protein